MPRRVDNPKLRARYRDIVAGVEASCGRLLRLSGRESADRVALVFNVNRGEVEAVDVSDLTVAAIVDSPKVMTDGNWKLGVFIDAAASDEQAAKLGAFGISFDGNSAYSRSSFSWAA